MNFIEKDFLWLILAVFGLWLMLRRYPLISQGMLLVGSLTFYAFHKWQLVFLILAYCIVDWLIAHWLLRSRRPRLVLALGVGLNLLGLAFWKYTPLLIHSAAWLAFQLDLGKVTTPEKWFLPIGISFYAFTGIAYMVDVYRGDTPAEKNPFRFALYISFFPQLVAGPILRASEFLSALQPQNSPTKIEAPLEAMALIARGFFKKMVLADRIALVINPFFENVTHPSTDGVWSLPYIWLFAFQIYFDFSGYTDIARGLGLLFGFRWPDNFNLPYLASSVQEFWQRWHITLSRFLRDYLYIPLGGNRGGNWLTMRNLMITMLLGGLWHGASWTFLIWGGLHGIYLALHRVWRSTPIAQRLDDAPRPVQLVARGVGIVLTFHLVCLAWCFFRLNVLAEGLICVRKWFVFDADKIFVAGSADLSVWLLLALYGVLTLLAHQTARLFGSKDIRELQGGRGAAARGFMWGTTAALLLLAFVLSPIGEKAPFIYFRF